jgi:hypothetical protein
MQTDVEEQMVKPQYQTFVDDLEYGHIDENRLSEYLYLHVLSSNDCKFLAEHRVTIPMIVCGRLTQDHPNKQIKEMVIRWNEEIGHRVIFPEYIY